MKNEREAIMHMNMEARINLANKEMSFSSEQCERVMKSGR